MRTSTPRQKTKHDALIVSDAGKTQRGSALNRKKRRGIRQSHFFSFALYRTRSLDARPLPRGWTGHVQMKGRWMKEAVTAAQQRPGFPLRSESRSFGSLEDGNENSGQLAPSQPSFTV